MRELIYSDHCAVEETVVLSKERKVALRIAYTLTHAYTSAIWNVGSIKEGAVAGTGSAATAAILTLILMIPVLSLCQVSPALIFLICLEAQTHPPFEATLLEFQRKLLGRQLKPSQKKREKRKVQERDIGTSGKEQSQ